MLLYRARLSHLLRSCSGQLRFHSTRSAGVVAPGPTKEFKVVLDESSRTVYVEQPLAEALGWSTETPAENGVPLTLRGWEPNYFVITRSGSEAGQDTPSLYEYSTTNVPHADELARSTIDSSRDPQMREALDYLKER